MHKRKRIGVERYPVYESKVWMIKIIAKKRAAYMLHVYPDLMGTAGLQR